MFAHRGLLKPASGMSGSGCRLLHVELRRSRCEDWNGDALIARARVLKEVPKEVLMARVRVLAG